MKLSQKLEELLRGGFSGPQWTEVYRLIDAAELNAERYLKLKVLIQRKGFDVGDGEIENIAISEDFDKEVDSLPRKKKMSNVLETQFKTLLDQYGIEYVQQPGRKADFFLPLLNLYVEVTAHATERTLDLLESLDGKNVLVLVGLGSVKAFEDLLSVKIFEARKAEVNSLKGFPLGQVMAEIKRQRREEKS